MDLLAITFSVCVLCIILILSLRYLSIFRWFSGQAYVLSKKQESFTILEVLELFKNSKPFPVSYQKGWKIHRFIHGHRVWFHFLTFTQAPSCTSNSAQNAPCIKVFATFDRVRASAQSLLQLVKDASLSCEWKPGVIAARSVHEVPASEVNGRGKGKFSSPVLNDFVRVEHVQPTGRSSRANSTSVTPTIIEDYKRYWHKEDNGCSWLLQMNEESQALVFFLIQPVEASLHSLSWFDYGSEGVNAVIRMLQDPDHSLLTVVTWSAPHSAPIIPVDEAPSVLLSSLSEYIHLRRVQMVPLVQISLPHRIVNNNSSSALPRKTGTTSTAASSPPQENSFLSRFRQYVQQKANSSNDNNDADSSSSKLTLTSDTLRKPSSILHYRSSSTGSGLLSKAGLNSDQSQIIEEENESDDDSAGDSEQSPSVSIASGKVEDGVDVEADETGEKKRGQLRRAYSEGAHRHGISSPSMTSTPLTHVADKSLARYRTMVNQAAADVMAEALAASNIDLDTEPSVQAENCKGWTYVGFVNNIVTLKKIPPNGSTVQSYIGKGFILAPPKTVWDAIRNPRTRFTYDDTLKKVDVVEQVAQGLKIVYLYQEVQQLLRKESCDVCCLQGERVEASKHILAYTSVEHPSAPPVDGVARGQMLSSGWIVEPVRKEKQIHSLVTYLMQVDYGATKFGAGVPFEDMMSKHPMSLYYLQQYLKPAVQLARRKSAPVLPL